MNKWLSCVTNFLFCLCLICIMCLCGLIFYKLICGELNTSEDSILTSVLSILVTVLIGWNIFQLIDIRGFKHTIEEDVNEKVRGVLATLYYNSYQSFKNNSIVGAITSLILCINQLLKNTEEEEDNIKRIIDELNNLSNDLSDNDKFGENNVRILKRNIKEIKKNKDYKIYKNYIDATLNSINNRIKKEFNYT